MTINQKDLESDFNLNIQNMETITFDKLLLKTAFCCMASDGSIDKKEIDQIKILCKNSPLFKDFDFIKEINELVSKINKNSKEFISYYFELLESSTLSENEELTLISFAIQTIKADEQIEYSEIKFFKNIRYRLTISDDVIASNFSDIDDFLEADVKTDSFLDKIKAEYFESNELPQFDILSIS
jgi:uncharacterized tellurite resistance protein B-like protein